MITLREQSEAGYFRDKADLIQVGTPLWNEIFAAVSATLDEQVADAGVFNHDVFLDIVTRISGNPFGMIDYAVHTMRNLLIARCGSSFDLPFVYVRFEEIPEFVRDTGLHGCVAYLAAWPRLRVWCSDEASAVALRLRFSGSPCSS